MRVDPELIAAAILATLEDVHQEVYAGHRQTLKDYVRQRWPGFADDEFEQALAVLSRVGGATSSHQITDEFVRVDRSAAYKGLRAPANANFRPAKAVPLLWEYGQFGDGWLRSVWPEADSELNTPSDSKQGQAGGSELPPGVEEISGGRVFTGPTGSMDNIPGQPGDILFEYPEQIGDSAGDDGNSAEHNLLPASDRLVPLDHNSAPYKRVRDGLVELREELRSANDLDCAPDERSRLLASMDAAERLWDAAQLTVIQIKVGIIITMQETIDLLAKVGKAVGKSVLIDLVKAIVKHATGIDL